MSANCPKCRREQWEGDLAINVDQCEYTGSVTCVLTMNQNSLVDSAKSIAKMLVARTLTREEILQLRTALAVVEHVRPSSTTCPLCSKPLVVSRSVVAVHHARNDDTRPCDASYRSVIGGFLMEAQK